MTLMWLSFALLALVALMFVVVPFLRKETPLPADDGSNAELVDIYLLRRGELEEEKNNGRIEQGAFDDSVIELKRRLLNELAPEKSLTSSGSGKLMALTGALFLLAGSGVFYTFTGSQAQLSAWERAMQELPELGKKAVMQSNEPLSANELQALTLGLRTKLAENGDDEVAWMMLGRVAMMLNDFEMAMQAFDKALAMNPDNLNVKLSYAQTLLIQGSDDAMRRAGGLLSEVLRVQPNNLDAISMLALIAYERKDWAEAKAAFSMIRATMDQSDPRYAMISERIAEIDGRIAQASPQTESGGGVGFTVNVTLAEALVDKLPQNGTLFIFARAVNGPRMPLAVVRKESFAFPLAVRLSEQDAMMAGMSLANFAEVEVLARVSVDGNVAQAPGELEGRSGSLVVADTEQVSVEINQVLNEGM